MLMCIAQSYFPHEARVKLFVVLLVDCVVIRGCNYVALGHTRHSPLLLVFSRLDNTHLHLSVGMPVSNISEILFGSFNKICLIVPFLAKIDNNGEHFA